MEFIQLLYPTHCPLCDRVMAFGEYICPSCRLKLHPLRGDLCRKCGRVLREGRLEYCPDCLERRHLFREGRSLYDYREVRRAIYRFKYMKRPDYGDFFGRALGEEYGPLLRRWGVDLIVPVPLHPERLRKRGYNQALIIARVLSRATGIPVSSTLVKRIKNTAAMKNLQIRERENNLKRAFKISPDVVKLGTLVLVDDIYTTGTTIDSISRLLLEKGAAAVYSLTLAMS